MAELKTKPTDQSVEQFLDGVADEEKRQDCYKLVEMMKQATRAEPKMWGTSIVGLGDYHYQYATGREGDWFLMGFSPRKQNLTLYLMGGLEQHAALFEKLGKHSAGKGCVYVKRLSDLHLPTLRKILQQVVKQAASGK